MWTTRSVSRLVFWKGRNALLVCLPKRSLSAEYISMIKVMQPSVQEKWWCGICNPLGHHRFAPKSQFKIPHRRRSGVGRGTPSASEASGNIIRRATCVISNYYSLFLPPSHSTTDTPLRKSPHSAKLYIHIPSKRSPQCPTSQPTPLPSCRQSSHLTYRHRCAYPPN